MLTGLTLHRMSGLGYAPRCFLANDVSGVFYPCVSNNGGNADMQRAKSAYAGIYKREAIQKTI